MKGLGEKTIFQGTLYPVSSLFACLLALVAVSSWNQCHLEESGKNDSGITNNLAAVAADFS